MIEATNRALDEGGLFGLGLRVDDCRKTYDDLRTKGVEFIQLPELSRATRSPGLR